MNPFPRSAVVLLLTAACGLSALAGCKSWAEAGQTADIVAPETVHRGEKLVFSVAIRDKAGAVIPGMQYQWKVSWEGVEGIYHKGKAGAEEKINVKGAAGKGSLHVFGYDAAGNLAEIGRHDFKVE